MQGTGPAVRHAAKIGGLEGPETGLDHRGHARVGDAGAAIGIDAVEVRQEGRGGLGAVAAAVEGELQVRRGRPSGCRRSADPRRPPPPDSRRAP